MEKKSSFSYSINHMIALVFGMAFFVLFFASTVLLFLSEDNMPAFYGKTFLILLIYMALYVLAFLYASNKIKAMFAPLDRAAATLSEEGMVEQGNTADLKVLARQISERMEEMDDISDALSSAQDDLKDIYEESEESRSRFGHQAKHSRGNLDNVVKSCERLREQLEQISGSLEKGSAIEKKCMLARQSLEEDSESVRESLQECSRSNQEMKEDKERQKDTYEVLNDMQKESIELIETVYSEITYLQDLSAKLDLYAANVSLDYARSGEGNLNISAAMDEIKLVGRRLRDKMDDLTMLVIRTKNSIKLANDQTEYCMELDEDMIGSLDRADEKLSVIAMKLQGVMEISGEINNGISGMMNQYYDIAGIVRQEDKELQFLSGETDKIAYRLEEMERIMIK